MQTLDFEENCLEFVVFEHLLIDRLIFVAS